MSCQVLKATAESWTRLQKPSELQQSKRQQQPRQLWHLWSGRQPRQGRLLPALMSPKGRQATSAWGPKGRRLHRLRLPR